MPTAKKELVVFPNQFSMWEIKWEGGGQLPDALKGEYTTKGMAEDVIKHFRIMNSRKVEKTSAQTKRS